MEDGSAVVEKFAFGRKLGGGPKKNAVSRTVKAGLQFQLGASGGT
jgi:histone H2A